MLTPTATMLERYMDLLAARQRITAGNIANADTPGYKAREIDFRAEMQSLLASGNPDRKPFLPIAVREAASGPVKNDGNNVNLDRELQALADNAIRFTVASMLLQKQVRGIRNAIHEGRSGA